MQSHEVSMLQWLSCSDCSPIVRLPIGAGGSACTVPGVKSCSRFAILRREVKCWDTVGSHLPTKHISGLQQTHVRAFLRSSHRGREARHGASNYNNVALDHGRGVVDPRFRVAYCRTTDGCEQDPRADARWLTTRVTCQWSPPGDVSYRARRFVAATSAKNCHRDSESHAFVLCRPAFVLRMRAAVSSFDSYHQVRARRTVRQSVNQTCSP